MGLWWQCQLMLFVARPGVTLRTLLFETLSRDRTRSCVRFGVSALSESCEMGASGCCAL